MAGIWRGRGVHFLHFNLMFHVGNKKHHHGNILLLKRLINIQIAWSTPIYTSLIKTSFLFRRLGEGSFSPSQAAAEAPFERANSLVKENKRKVYPIVLKEIKSQEEICFKFDFLCFSFFSFN